MAGGERRRFVEEEQLGVARAPDVAPAALEFADAGDPLPARPAPPPERLVVAVEAAAAIAHQRAARRRRAQSSPNGSTRFGSGRDALDRARLDCAGATGATPGAVPVSSVARWRWRPR